MGKSLIGVVSSDKADKTIVVSVERRKTHPIYRKQYSITRRFKAHDEKNQAAVGDTVEVTETTPISRHKHFTLKQIITRAPIEHKESTDKEDVS
jgi:small subunit ribosomal protein S17